MFKNEIATTKIILNLDRPANWIGGKVIIYCLCAKDFLSYHNIFLFSALLCKIAALRTFSLEKLQYWRERASGMSSLAYFLAKDTIDHFNTVIKPVVYLSMFYFFTNPRSSFADNYAVLLCLVYCVTGIAYALAIFFEPGSAQLVSNASNQVKIFASCRFEASYIIYLY